VMESFHHEQLPVYRIMELIHQCRGFGNVGICKQDMPARLLPLYPSVYPLSILFSRETFNVFNEPSQPLSQRAVEALSSIA